MWLCCVDTVCAIWTLSRSLALTTPFRIYGVAPRAVRVPPERTVSVCLFLVASGTPPQPCAQHDHKHGAQHSIGGVPATSLTAQTRAATSRSIIARNGSRDGLYNVSALYGWRDEIDGPLFAEGVSIFEAAIRASELSLATCRERTKCIDKRPASWTATGTGHLNERPL